MLRTKTKTAIRIDADTRIEIPCDGHERGADTSSGAACARFERACHFEREFDKLSSRHIQLLRHLDRHLTLVDCDLPLVALNRSFSSVSVRSGFSIIRTVVLMSVLRRETLN